MQKEIIMATMSPEEFLKEHGLKPEYVKPFCQEWLCDQYQDDLNVWLQQGRPVPSEAYNAVVRDVAAMNHLGCKCTPQ